MAKLVSELAQGNAFSLSSQNGQGAYSATRVWKVILETPNEALDISEAIGVKIGDEYSVSNPIPCVSIEGRADGDSRLVRIITATYQATAGSDTGSAGDPKKQEPTVRPALYSMSTSLQEIAAWGGRIVTGGVSDTWSPNVNPVGDIVDGITRLEPVVTVHIDQYSASDMSSYLGYVGYVNDTVFTFSGLSVAPHCCMLQGISANPIVEQFGDAIFRGFKVSFTFAIRAHYTYTRNGAEAIGWDVAVPQIGYNIVNKELQGTDVDQESLVLEHKEGRVVVPLALADGTDGKKMRAMVTIAASDGGKFQTPAAQPVALNDDGTPRSRAASPPVLVNRICLQPEMNFGANFSSFGIRWIQ